MTLILIDTATNRRPVRLAAAAPYDRGECGPLLHAPPAAKPFGALSQIHVGMGLRVLLDCCDRAQVLFVKGFSDEAPEGT
jgi:hypothetical protein